MVTFPRVICIDIEVPIASWVLLQPMVDGI
jgi:hypothetical protein